MSVQALCPLDMLLSTKYTKDFEGLVLKCQISHKCPFKNTDILKWQYFEHWVKIVKLISLFIFKNVATKNIDELQRHAKWKNPVTKGQIL